ncbi:polyphosphate kinase 1 [Carboxylicivirga sp. M1479]|uniref:polyphosphate kinase 1 n=1 Tax=Carboxylicivirga sp. M1479 TaxID=2594476 RepID=UPI001178911D|nr:polyphosphate kinase 1 [Carboxylicivirga sp. M1479]TRX70207.1 polyphosphate kinase 1 [Carboxylicivirga sp. M1479]
MKYIDRDISWLAFNERILQEVENPDIPLLERLKFIAIYSSNLEEFYKVRVASLRFSQKYKGDKKNKYAYRPSFILQEINSIVSKQQEKLGELFYHLLLPAMSHEGIHFLFDKLNDQDQQLAEQYFQQHIKEDFSLIDITNEPDVELKNQAIYLYILDRQKTYLLEMDYEKWGRFITLHNDKKGTRIIQLDDIFRYNLKHFVGVNAKAYAVKISRDAELYIDDEQDADIVHKIKKSLKKRETGLPSRLLFNEDIPFKYINKLRKQMNLDMTSLIPGGKYHSYYDFFTFPEFKDKMHLYFSHQAQVPCTRLDESNNWFDEIQQQDVFLSYPYQDFNYVSRFLMMAAEDPDVTEINITLYRVNDSSDICKALELAAQKGKHVFVLAEVQARFDEVSNIYWGERLKEAGAKVKFGLNKLKVHAKTFTIHRKENTGSAVYAYLGTGNLNEKTAKIYADHGVLTADMRFTTELNEVFRYMKKETSNPKFHHLLVAPFTLRQSLADLLDKEIRLAKQGVEGLVHIKVNSLEDLSMIDHLRETADAGVKIKLVVRGICCYTPLTEKQQQNITIVSVVDQYLEHTRIYHFNNGGNPKVYLASADWMTRNLSGRIEVCFPIWDSNIQSFLLKQIKTQLADSKKGRINDNVNNNQYLKGNNSKSSQEMMFIFVKELMQQTAFSK